MLIAWGKGVNGFVFQSKTYVRFKSKKYTRVKNTSEYHHQSPMQLRILRFKSSYFFFFKKNFSFTGLSIKTYRYFLSVKVDEIDKNKIEIPENDSININVENLKLDIKSKDLNNVNIDQKNSVNLNNEVNVTINVENPEFDVKKQDLNVLKKTAEQNNDSNEKTLTDAITDCTELINTLLDYEVIVGNKKSSVKGAKK